MIGPAVTALFIEMDGAQVPMVRSDLKAEPAASKDNLHARVRSLGCVFTQTTTDEQDPASVR